MSDSTDLALISDNPILGAQISLAGRDDLKERVRATLMQRIDPAAAGRIPRQRLRAEVARGVAGGESRRGGIWAALRRSPLVGAGLNFEREVVRPRDVDL